LLNQTSRLFQAIRRSPRHGSPKAAEIGEGIAELLGSEDFREELLGGALNLPGTVARIEGVTAGKVSASAIDTRPTGELRPGPASSRMGGDAEREGSRSHEAP